MDAPFGLPLTVPPWPRSGPVAGVDEAGRGPVLGPLVVAGVLAPSERAVRALGVKDSKKLSPKKRETLDAEIRARFRVAVRVIPNDELDHRMTRDSLNAVEAEAFAEVLRELDAPRAYVDACDTVPARYAADIQALLGNRVPVRAFHGADDRYASVAAASIVAKVLRDAEVARIAADLGCSIGSGYVHDERTMAWLRAYVSEHRRLPDCARKMWAPARAVLAERAQTTLFGETVAEVTAAAEARRAAAAKRKPGRPKTVAKAGPKASAAGARPA